MTNTPNRNTADPRPIQPPTKADGSTYAYELIFSGGNSRGYGDTSEELMALLIPDYPAAADAMARLRLRMRFVLDAAVHLQAAILSDPALESALDRCPPIERAMLGQSRAIPPAPLVWSSNVPLVLVATDYAPITETPRPRGTTGTQGEQDTNIIWLDPISEETLLLSCAEAGLIVVGERRAVIERAASLAPYNTETGSGIRWASDRVTLWERGEQIAVAAYLSASAWKFWHNLDFAVAFPEITHWHCGSVWTGRYRLSEPSEQEITESTVLHGTIQYVDEESDLLGWSLDRSTSQWVIDVPLPPFEQTSNILLRLALSEGILALVGGDIASDTWRIASGIVLRDNLERALPLTWQNWCIADGIVSPRAALCQTLNLKEVA